MKHDTKLSIYKGIIQYLLDNTNYSLKSTALLSKASYVDIRSIYSRDQLPTDFNSELKLVQLFQMILEINLNEERRAKVRRYENI